MMKQNSALIFLLAISLSGCNNRSEKADNPLANTIYKLGRKTTSFSTGPQENSAFLLKVNDTTPALLLTAHHVVAGTDDGQFLRWDELGRKKDQWAWSMTDSTYEFGLGPNLPIPGAETLKLDLAAFYVTQKNLPYLRPADQTSVVGDTVYLYSKLRDNRKTNLMNRAVVIYATDSIMVYELTDLDKNIPRLMSGTSGSCVLNKNKEVVANSYGGLSIPNEEIKTKMAIEYPLINKLNLRYGKTYGIGVPVALIKETLTVAFKNK